MKKADIKNLSAGDIQAQLTEAKAQYSKLKLAHESAQLKILFKSEI
jgi:large subunit ribosomal protein L29